MACRRAPTSGCRRHRHRHRHTPPPRASAGAAVAERRDYTSGDRTEMESRGEAILSDLCLVRALKYKRLHDAASRSSSFYISRSSS